MLNKKTFSSEKETKINYLNLGKNLETFQVSLAKANKIFKPTSVLYSILLDEYIEKSVSLEHINDIKENFLANQKPDYDLFNFKLVKFYITNFWTDESEDLAELMRCFPDNKFAYFFYKLSEHKLVNKVQKIILKDIRTNQILFLEREIFEEVLINSPNYPFKWKILGKDFKPEIFDAVYFKNLDLTKKNQDKKFGIRFISDSKLNFFKLLNLPDISEFVQDRFSKIIFHVHGGGFITMSSASHQQYLIKFAKKTNSCVFSIDYPKAPHFKYKDIVQCIFKSYLFVIVF